MIARASRPAIRAATSAAAAAPAVARTAGFHSSGAQLATLRELEQRVKSIKNIEKITKVCMRACLGKGMGGEAQRDRESAGRRSGMLDLGELPRTILA
jgi:hypothetical protein